MSDTMEKLFAIMDRLEASDFKRFKSYLYEKTLNGMEPIARGKIESSDSTDVAGKMKDAYGQVGCAVMCMHILHKMNKAHLLCE